LKSHHVPKSEIIGITGQNSDVGIDAYDRGDEDD